MYTVTVCIELEDLQPSTHLDNQQSNTEHLARGWEMGVSQLRLEGTERVVGEIVGGLE